MKHTRFAAIAVSVSMAIASSAHAFGPVGGGFGPSAGGPPQITSGTGGFGMQNILISPRLSEQRYRDLKVVGRVPVDPNKLPAGARIVRLRVNEQEIAMRLDTETSGGELEFLPDEEMARDLYRSILTKRIEVVGDAGLRDRIVAAAGTTQAIEVEGYVFDRMSPYLVVKRVEIAK
jgi:hypothetical protein